MPWTRRRPESHSRVRYCQGSTPALSPNPRSALSTNPRSACQPDATPVGQDGELLDTEVDHARGQHRHASSGNECCPPAGGTDVSVAALGPVVRCLGEEPLTGLVLGHDVAPRAQANHRRVHGWTVAPIRHVLRRLASAGQDVSVPSPFAVKGRTAQGRTLLDAALRQDPDQPREVTHP
jgi:hypothetical protein